MEYFRQKRVIEAICILLSLVLQIEVTDHVSAKCDEVRCGGMEMLACGVDCASDRGDDEQGETLRLLNIANTFRISSLVNAAGMGNVGGYFKCAKLFQREDGKAASKAIRSLRSIYCVYII